MTVQELTPAWVTITLTRDETWQARGKLMFSLSAPANLGDGQVLNDSETRNFKNGAVIQVRAFSPGAMVRREAATDGALINFVPITRVAYAVTLSQTERNDPTKLYLFTD